MDCSKSARVEDCFSNVPDIVIDKILERLPIHIAAQTSLLSKQWRRSWLSLNSLVFDSDFWVVQNGKDHRFIWQKCSSIISSIILHHNGPVYSFHLDIPDNSREECMNHSQWLCYLSKNNIRKIVIRNSSDCMKITSSIFWCSELVHLELSYLTLSPLPTGFNGYRNLKHLELIGITFSKANDLCNLLANCSNLATFRLEKWRCMNHIVIDVPSLKTLILKGYYLKCLALRNLRNLENVSVSLNAVTKKHLTDGSVDVVNTLASLPQIKSVYFGGKMCELLAKGGIKRSPPVALYCLNELCLNDLSFSGVGVFHCILDMIDCCPNIKKLDISVAGSGNLEQHELDYNFSITLNHLLEVMIKGITGSIAELKLIEYLLGISVVLEKLYVKSQLLDVNSELKLSRALMEFPRASPKVALGGNLEQHELDYNFSITLNHLLEVTIEYITGSSAELKLIEYLLANSVVLEKLFFYSLCLDDKRR